MAKKQKKIKIFISYSWAKNSKYIADQIYDDFSIIPLNSKIELIKDDKVLNYKFSIEDFMENIRKADYAILLIGEMYLKSLNCMKEVLHLRKDTNQKKKILPILIGDANIFDAIGRLEFVKYWTQKKDELNHKIKGLNPTTCISTIEEIKVIEEIESSMDSFLKEISSIHVSTFQELKDENYNKLFNYCKIDLATHTNIFTPILIDKNKHLLDQTYDAIELYYQSFSFLPIARLKLLYPFNLRGNAYKYGGGIHTDNDDLIKLLQDIESLHNGESNSSVEEIKKIKDYKNKITKIIKVLCKNLVFTLSNTRTQISINSLNNKLHKNCDCLKCCFESFNFQKLFVQLNNNIEPDLNDSMQKAFIHYKLGNYNTALTIFEACSNQAKKYNNVISKYICDRNIVTLKSLLNRRVRNDSDSLYNIYNETQSILPNEKDLLNSGFNIDFIDWINKNKFFSTAFYDLDLIFREIRNHYYICQNGGYSYNSNASNLIYTYFDLFGFLYHNYILYDFYLDYTNFARKYIEGFFICLALPPSQGIQYIDNSFIYQALFYAEPQDLIDYSNRYKLTSIKYNDKDGERKFVNFFSNYSESFNNIDSSKLDNGNNKFTAYNKRLLNNFLILANVLDLSKDELKIFSDELDNLLDKIELDLFSFRYLLNFCSNKIGNVPYNNSIKLLQKIFNSEEFRFESNAHGFSKILEKNNIPIEDITKFNTLLDTIETICSKCGETHQIDDLLPILIMFKSERETLNNYLINRLTNNFDGRLYYLSTYYQAIDYSIFWNLFLTECINQTINNPEKQDVFHKEENFSPNYYFGMLIDLCFRFSIDTTDKQYDEIREINDFYKWILNMQDFDYSKFDVQWLKFYKSDIFAKKYATIEPIKYSIKEYLRANKDTMLESFYVNYY